MGFSLSKLAKKVVGSSSGSQGILNTLNPLRGGTQGLADLGDPLSQKVNDMVDKNDPLDDSARQNDNNAAQSLGMAPPDPEPYVEPVVPEVGHRGARRHSRGNQVILGTPSTVTPEAAAANATEFSQAWNDANGLGEPATGALAPATSGPATPAPAQGPINLLANNILSRDASDQQYRDSWFGNAAMNLVKNNNGGTSDSSKDDDTSELGRRLGLGT